jgi:hypothetical protein
MHHNHETIDDVDAKCVDTSNNLRRYLFSGQAMPWTVRRDVATVANLLVDLSTELKEGQQSNDETTELLDTATALV